MTRKRHNKHFEVLLNDYSSPKMTHGFDPRVIYASKAHLKEAIHPFSSYGLFDHYA